MKLFLPLLVALFFSANSYAGLFNFPDFNQIANNPNAAYVKIYYITRGFTGSETEDCILKGVDGIVKCCTLGTTEALGWTIGHSAIVVVAYDENDTKLGYMTFGYGAGAENPEDFAWSVFDIDGSDRILRFERNKFPCLKRSLDKVMTGMQDAPYWPFAFSAVGSENCHTAADQIWGELQTVNTLPCAEEGPLFTVATTGGSGLLGYFSRTNLYTYTEAVALCYDGGDGNGNGFENRIGHVPSLAEIRASNYDPNDFHNTGCLWVSNYSGNPDFPYAFVPVGHNDRVYGGNSSHHCKVLCIENGTNLTSTASATPAPTGGIQASPPPEPKPQCDLTVHCGGCGLFTYNNRPQNVVPGIISADECNRCDMHSPTMSFIVNKVCGDAGCSRATGVSGCTVKW